MPSLVSLGFLHNQRPRQIPYEMPEDFSHNSREIIPPYLEEELVEINQKIPEGSLPIGKLSLILGQGTNTAGMTAEGVDATSIRFFAGADFANRATAPFRVEADGSVVATDLTIGAVAGTVGGWVITAATLYGLASGTPSVVPADGIVMTSGASANIRVYEDTEIRIQLGFLSAGVYGLRGFATNGTTVIFELSDALQQIAGFTFTDTQMSAAAGGNTTIVSSGATAFTAGPTGAPTFTVTQAGALTSVSGAIAAFTIAATTISATNLTLTSGASNTANITVGTGATAGGLNSAAAGGDITFWSGDTFANRAIAAFRVTAAGAVTATSATITGALTTGVGSSVDGVYLVAASVASAAVNLAIRSWTTTIAFSVTDADTVAWGAGDIILSDGTTYAILAGNTGNMVARTYIYLDIAVSTTVLQTTTTASSSVGNGRKLIATAINGTDEASFLVFSGDAAQNLPGSSIVALSITGNEVAANTITAGKLIVAVLSAITADMGTITAGSITAGTATIGGFDIGASTISATNLSIVSGVANTARITVGTGSDLAGMNSGAVGADIAFWAGDTFANRAIAPFRVDLDGNVVATSITSANVVTTFQLAGTTLTATATEINQALDGISANVTFTNLNDLTDGGVLASQLHYHFFKATTATRATGLGTGAQAIAHSLGVTPRYVRITATQDVGAHIAWSVGSATDTTDEAGIQWRFSSTGASDDATFTGNIIQLYTDAGSETGNGAASVSAIDATNVTINWGTAVANGDCLMFIECWG